MAGLMWPWLIVNGLWVICLIMQMGILGHFGFKDYVKFLVPFAVFAVFFLLDVGWFTLNILRTTGSYEVKPLPMQDFDDGRTPALESSSAV
ncbi:hypothetical protein FJT64_013110 [Amphibalanus amphitrite]|uniref:Uncharacterized protein n=1 Tax=Amphibalanus amphitrite TaxID=1232801 RepID=A0A6A4V442_AMPAM|nr:hypothetical protein FJT64_013110 [Amphibalanus amphitrite]